MTGRTLEAVRKALHLHPANFARYLGKTQVQLKKQIKKYYDDPITDVDFLQRVAYVVPQLVMQRMGELQNEAKILQQFGSEIQQVAEQLKSEAKQQRWKERFDDSEKSVVELSTSQAEARMIENLSGDNT